MKKIAYIVVVLLFVCVIYITTTKQKTQVCEYVSSEDKKDIDLLRSTLEEFNELSKKDPNNSKIVEKQNKYGEIEMRLAKSQYLRVDKKDLDAIYAQYCNSSIVSSKSYNVEYVTDDMGTLMCNLEEERTPLFLRGKALHELGFKLNKVGDFDYGIKFYTCAADKYTDPVAMYRMAQIYYQGSDALKDMYPDTFNIDNPIAIDYSKAYAWAAKYIEHIKSGPTEYRDKYEYTTWNVIGILDNSEQRIKNNTTSLLINILYAIYNYY